MTRYYRACSRTLRGGKARAKVLTKKERSDIAKAAAKARWGNTAEIKVSNK